MTDTFDKILKWLGIIWSFVAIVVGAAFFMGGEWTDWKAVKNIVLNNASVSDSKLAEISSRISRLEERIEGIQLKVVDVSQSPIYGCSGTGKADESSTIVMYGITDGTGCKVHNVNYYKKLDIFIPPKK